MLLKSFWVLLAVFAFAGSPKDIKGSEVLILTLDAQLLAELQFQSQDDTYLEVRYLAGKRGVLIHEEPAERLWWMAKKPVVVLGASGLPLPGKLLDRTAVWAEIYAEGLLVWEGEIFPRKQRLRFSQDGEQIAKQLAKGANLRFDSSYLAEVANFIAGNSLGIDVDADSYQLDSEFIIDRRGINISTVFDDAGWGTTAGNYFRFSAKRSALRAGGLDEPSRWFLTNSGAYSGAIGFNNIAKGAYSMSFGNTTESYGESSVTTGALTRTDGNFSFAGGENAETDGDHAFSFGSNTQAEGDKSVAFGSATQANGVGSSAFGSSTLAEGTTSFAAGSAAKAMGTSSVAMGFNADALGESSVAMGNFTNANGPYSVAMGQSNNSSYAATSIGRYNVDNGSASLWLSADPLFTIGNGSNGIARHNAFEISKAGFMQVRRDVDAAGTNPTHYVASFINEEPTQGGDVLALSVLPDDPNASSNFIAFFGGNGIVGGIDGNGLGGVSYKSGAADLAEWFPTADGEALQPGEVLSLRDGAATKMTQNATQAFVISTAPFLVGNDKMDETNAGQSLVALVGQVPVKVMGEVQAGDVLVPSGKNDGKARVLQPQDGLVPIIGTALTSTKQTSDSVMVLVGTQGQVHPTMARMIRENQQLRTELASMKRDLKTVLAHVKQSQNHPVRGGTKELAQ